MKYDKKNIRRRKDMEQGWKKNREREKERKEGERIGKGRMRERKDRGRGDSTEKRRIWKNE